jgi:hypothetical protein
MNVVKPSTSPTPALTNFINLLGITLLTSVGVTFFLVSAVLLLSAGG